MVGAVLIMYSYLRYINHAKRPLTVEFCVVERLKADKERTFHRVEYIINWAVNLFPEILVRITPTTYAQTHTGPRARTHAPRQVAGCQEGK